MGEGMACSETDGPSKIGLSLFQSMKAAGFFAFTSDATGQVLPDKYAPWRKVKPADGLQFFREDCGLSPRAVQGVRDAVRANGFCLACSRSTFSGGEETFAGHSIIGQ